MKAWRSHYVLLAIAIVGVAGLVAGIVQLKGWTGQLTGTIGDTPDNWVRGITYETTDEVATQMVAQLQEDRGWWTEPAKTVETSADNVAEPPTSTDASGGAVATTTPAQEEPVEAAIPTARQVNSAFLRLLQDKDRTLAPLLDDMYYEGKSISSLIRPNIAEVTGYTQDMQLTKNDAEKLWTGVVFKARIHDGLLDDDSDGVPNYFEKYGFTIVTGSGGGTPLIIPWGVRMKGRSIYESNDFHEARKRTDGSWVGLSSDITGNDFEIIPPSELDYGVAYFKTDPAQGSSDADPYGDGLEAEDFPRNDGQKDPDRTKHPSVAAQPELVVDLVDYTVVPDEKVTDSQGRDYAELRQSMFATVMGWKMPPKQWDGQTSLLPRPSPAIALSPFAIVGTAYAENAPAATSGTDIQGILKALPWGEAAKQVIAFFSPQPNGATVKTSTAKTTNPSEAARLKLTVKLRNIGPARASETSGRLVVSIGGKTIANPQFGNCTLGAGASSDPFLADGNDRLGKGIILDIDQFKSFTSGGAVEIRVDPTALVSEVFVPEWKEGIKYVDKSAGKWAEYSDDIQKACATIFVDDGADGLLRVSVAPGATTTVRDALYWALGSYESSGNAYALTDLRMRTPGTAGTWKTLAADVDEMAESGAWKFVFDDRRYSGADLSNAFDVPLKAGSTVYIFNQSAIKAPVIGSARMMIDGGDVPKKKITAVIETHNSLTPIEAYFLADAQTTPSAANKMTYEDGHYTITLPNHTFTGRETVLARTYYPEPSNTYESTRAVDFMPIPVAVTLFQNLGGLLSSEEPYLRSRVGAIGPIGRDDWVTAVANNGVAAMEWSPRADLRGRENSNQGAAPTVAMRHDGTVVAAFDDSGPKYRVGTLNPETKAISWGDRLELGGPGVGNNNVSQPSMAISEDGPVLAAFTASWSGGGTTVMYQAGTVNRSSRRIEWGSRFDLRAAADGGTKGHHPAVAISPDGRTAVVVEKDGKQRFYRVGRVNGTNMTVGWSERRAMPTNSINSMGPTSMALRNDGAVVFAWQESTGHLGALVGKVDPSVRSIAWGAPAKVSCVEDSDAKAETSINPAIALKADGTVMVVFRSHGLKCRLGKLDAGDRRIDWSVRNEIRQDNGDWRGANPTVAIVDLR